jgi:hypothetical protein
MTVNEGDIRLVYEQRMKGGMIRVRSQLTVLDVIIEVEVNFLLRVHVDDHGRAWCNWSFSGD